jgi:hypothetical protein
MAHSVKRARPNRPKSEPERVQDLQSRVDDLLAGRVEGKQASPENDRLFAEFLPSDKDRAISIAARCMRTAQNVGGIAGLEAAVNELYQDQGEFPIGMVEYAAKIFLTHYKPARELLQIRSLEERQPASVRPSHRESRNLELVNPKTAS